MDWLRLDRESSKGKLCLNSMRSRTERLFKMCIPILLGWVLPEENGAWYVVVPGLSPASCSDANAQYTKAFGYMTYNHGLSKMLVPTGLGNRFVKLPPGSCFMLGMLLSSIVKLKA